MFDPDRRHLIAYLAAAAVLVVIAARYLGRGGEAAPLPSVSMAAPASAQPRRPARSPSPDRAPAPRPSIWIDVAGAVRRPGLYSLPRGARVAAALEQAGGVRPHTNRAAVNLAAKLSDGQQVFVPMLAPGQAGVPAAGAATAGAGSAAGSSAPAAVSGPISLSSATQEQLETLDGIGPTLAGRIIAYREEHGGFRSVEELQEVSGIGEQRLAALADAVTP